MKQNNQFLNDIIIVSDSYRTEVNHSIDTGKGHDKNPSKWNSQSQTHKRKANNFVSNVAEEGVHLKQFNEEPLPYPQNMIDLRLNDVSVFS